MEYGSRICICLGSLTSTQPSKPSRLHADLSTLRYWWLPAQPTLWKIQPCSATHDAAGFIHPLDRYQLTRALAACRAWLRELGVMGSNSADVEAFQISLPMRQRSPAGEERAAPAQGGSGRTHAWIRAFNAPRNRPVGLVSCL